jgi:hypothetical protein
MQLVLLRYDNMVDNVVLPIVGVIYVIISILAILYVGTL